MDNRTFKSLEVPPHYFGCHVMVALFAILMPVCSLLSFVAMPGRMITASLIVLGTMTLSGLLFAIGAYLGNLDPFWVEGGHRHLMDEKDYLDV